MGKRKPIDWLAANIGRRVKAARAEKNLTLAELGALVGVSAQAVGQWETGTHALSQASLVKLAEVTSKPAHWFYLPVDTCPACGQFLPVEVCQQAEPDLNAFDEARAAGWPESALNTELEAKLKLRGKVHGW